MQLARITVWTFLCGSGLLVAACSTPAMTDRPETRNVDGFETFRVASSPDKRIKVEYDQIRVRVRNETLGWRKLNQDVARWLDESRDTFVAEAQKDLAEAKKEFGDDLGASFNWEQQVSLKVTGLWDDLVSILVDTWEYTGGAHGNTTFSVLNYRVTDQDATLLAEEDFFRPDADYLGAVYTKCLADLRKQEAAWALDGSLEPFTKLPPFTLNKDTASMDFHFAPYAAGPYAQGPFVVSIPFTELAHLLNEDLGLAER